MEKQRLLYQQARLHERGAAVMVLQNLSASRGISQNAACSFIIFLSKAGVFILGSGDPQRATRGSTEKKGEKRKWILQARKKFLTPSKLTCYDIN